MAYTIADQHRAWLNPLQPEGLFVSATSLEEAQLAPPTDLRELQQRYLPTLDDPENPGMLKSWEAFETAFLDWPERLVLRGSKIPESLKTFLQEYGEEIAPTFVVIENGDPDSAPAVLLGMVLSQDADFDRIEQGDSRWPASATRRLERLLRETNVPIGIISNLREVRLVYAPRGENIGILTFPVAGMAEVWGRPILGGLSLLIGRNRLWGDVAERRLPALLSQSRKAQASVSTELAHQVLGSLYELLRGFAGANEQSKGALLDGLVTAGGQSIYGGLLTVLMRLVFLLYAEDRGLMPHTDIYEEAYSIHGLWKKLRDDAQRYPDTMDQRFGSWPRLLSLFLVVFEGCSHPELSLPARQGHLFDPERFPFLEGNGSLPALSDGCISRVLDGLMLLNGERLSYRSLDVEQIGSVYEAVMGFRFRVVGGLSIAIRPEKSHGAPPIVDLDALLATKSADRLKLFKELTDREPGKKTADAVKIARSVDELLAALGSLQETRATPYPVPAGGWVLEPTDERRKSGSHYTPRSLTEPIVRKALEPIWKQLGERPSPEAVKALKICDPAMGSGAFLVEACRQIAERLVDAWHIHKCVPSIPPDEDELLFAKRIIAQRCLYGVDRNPMAVDLAKLSLWLATLARDHPFTFLDHNLRFGDSLVGLGRAQIVAFHWNPDAPPEIGRALIEDRVVEASTIRRRILDSEESLNPETKATQLELANEALSFVRLAGDLVLEAWFSSKKDREREIQRVENLNTFQWAINGGMKKLEASAIVEGMKSGDTPIFPFHWEIEFPEVFNVTNYGFDVFVGNPPFLGGKRLSQIQGVLYNTWIVQQFTESKKNADLVSHFFRRAFDLLRIKGTFGLIATNTISQGDTRNSGLRYICEHGGTIYQAQRRLKWPGEAAVVVSVIHIQNSNGEIEHIPKVLDGHEVDFISAYLFHAGGSANPKRLATNSDRGFQGSILLGMGFTFDDMDKKGVATPIAEMKRLIAADERNASRIQPYLGGEEVNDSPQHLHHRYVINFGELTEDEAKAWPDLYNIVAQKVRPERQKKDASKYPRMVFEWWKYWNPRPGLYSRVSDTEYVLVTTRHNPHSSFAIVKADQVFAESLVVFPNATAAFFCILQSHVHEVWSRFFSSSMKDDLRYAPSDCFETFPFPPNWEGNAVLESAGTHYHEMRSAIMIDHNEGLTKTYNRFNDPDENDPQILKLRELHVAMDKVVLAAYGFDDIDTTCDFYLDYEVEDEDEGAGRTRRKPWRYRWPDEVRDEVLARLLELNTKQAAEQGEITEAPDDEMEDDDAAK